MGSKLMARGYRRYAQDMSAAANAPHAPRKRPAGSVVLLALSGHVRARPKAVFDAMHARFSAIGSADGVSLADPNAFLFISFDGAWRRGEYRIVPDADGSHVEFNLVNVAPERRWNWFARRRAVRSTPTGFERLIKDLKIALQ